VCVLQVFFILVAGSSQKTRLKRKGSGYVLKKGVKVFQKLSEKEVLSTKKN